MNDSQASPSFQPLYKQVKQVLLQRLANHDWTPGALLPSEPRLAEELGVSSGTVRKALDEMTAQNLLVRRQGKGTFVAMHSPDRALFHFFHMVRNDGVRELPESTVLSMRQATASRNEREKLGPSASRKVIRIKRARAFDGIPAIVEDIAVCAKRFANLNKYRSGDLPNTIYRLYEERFKVVVTRAEERIRAVAADRTDAKYLDIPAGSPVLEIDRLAFGHENDVIEWRVSRCVTAEHYYLSELD